MLARSRRIVAILLGVVQQIGADEAVLGTGLACITAGLWPLVGMAALIAPGVILVWLAVPPRAPFVRHGPTDLTPKRRTT